jgi:NitT/TauT family transport system substrate-binding protein
VVVVNMIGDVRVLMASPARKDVRSVEDLRGRMVGVPGLGSPNHLFGLRRHGIKSDELSFTGTGVGTSAVAALERGVVDAAVVTGSDSVLLKRRNPGVRMLAEATTPEGARAIWGAEAVPTAAVFGREDWIAANRDRVAKAVRADLKALRWLQAHSAEEIAAALPASLRTGDAEVDLEGMRLIKSRLSPDGLMPPDGAAAVHRALVLTQESLRNAQIDLAKTYTNEFVETADR